MHVSIQTDIEGVNGIVHWWNPEQWLGYSKDSLEVFRLREQMPWLLIGEANWGRNSHEPAKGLSPRVPSMPPASALVPARE